MTRVVAKFGGTSVGTIERIRHAAGLVADAVARGDTLAVVVSAMAGETDRLLGLAGEFSAGLGDVETDVVLAAGEQVSAALMALALRERGLQARSFLGWQAPVFTDGPPGAARIAGMVVSAFEAAMEAGIVPVLAGYQGIAADGRLRTLGRGGTDLSAAALAAALGARCDIYTDVDGVYTTDPRIEPGARRLDAISHDEMLELAAQGAKVLQARSVEFAKSRHVPMRVLSSFLAAGESRGTDILPDRDIAERRVVSGVAYARDQARIAVLGAASQSGFASETFSILSEAGIGVDMIVQAHGREPDTVNLEFSVAHRDLDRAQLALERGLPGLRIGSETGLAKVSVVGAGLRQRADVARSLFGVLGKSGIAVKVLATSEIKISALIDNDAVERAVRALHAAYGLDRVGKLMEVKTPHTRDPRRLLRRMRELMATRENAQDRLDHLTTLIAEEAGWDVCSIYLARRSSALELCATHGLKAEAVHHTRLQPGEGLVGLVARRARPFATFDARSHPAFSYKPETGEEPFNTFVGVPILRGGRLVGVLTAQSTVERQVGEEEIDSLQTVAMVLAEIVASGDIADSEEMAGLDVRQSRPDRLQGGAFSGGLVKGVAVLFEPHVGSDRLISEDATGEEARLDAAIDGLRSSIDDMLEGGRVPFGGPTRDVLQAYRMFAHDRGWLERLREAVRLGLTAEAAIERVRNENRARLMKAADLTFRERLHDLEDLANRLLRHLDGAATPQIELPDNAILIARNIGPAELLDFDRTKLRGIALEEGSASSHAAIVAKALGIPLIGRLEGALDRAENGDPVILDAEFGVLHIRPPADVIEAYDERLHALSVRRLSYAEMRGPAVTRDGERIGLHINAGLLVELSHLSDAGADGVGLFRTEFQFMVADTLPRLDAQAAVYRSVLDAANGKPVVFRTLDLGGDKVAPFAPSMVEPNPALGWRAIRMGLDRPGLLRYQLRALILAAAGRPLHVMFPMISAPWEMRAARSMLERELQHAAHNGHPMPSEVKIGLMLETPGIAWAIEHVIDAVDFVSVGANDLMQYFFAADRQNSRVSDRYDVLSPAALGLFKQIRDACAAHNVPVSVCGEIAAKPLEAAVLLGLGYRSLSMAAANLGPIRKMVSGLDTAKLGTWLASRMDSPADSLRPLLLKAGTDAGLPGEAVENGRRI